MALGACHRVPIFRIAELVMVRWEHVELESGRLELPISGWTENVDMITAAREL